QLCILRFFDGGQQDGIGKVAATYDSQPYLVQRWRRTIFTGVRSGVPITGYQRYSPAHIWCSRISEQYAEKRLPGFTCYQIISFWSIVNCESVCDKGLHLDFSSGEKLWGGFHVSLFGPTHVGIRIIFSLYLIVQVISSRAIGP